jgi:hypothetical protein
MAFELAYVTEIELAMNRKETLLHKPIHIT